MTDSLTASAILDAIRPYRGTPYAMPPDGDATLDCSLFVLRVLADLGNPLPGGVRTAEQIRQTCTPVPFPEVRLGDLLFFADTYTPADPPGPDGHTASHVGISLGAGTRQMWDANNGRGNVGITDINTPYWQAHIFEARRAPLTVAVDPIPSPPSALTPTTSADARRLQVNAPGVRLRSAPTTAAEPLVNDLGLGTIVTALDDYDWRRVVTSRNQEGWIAARYLSPAPPVADPDALSMEPDHLFSFEDLRPHIESFASEHGTDPQVMAGIVQQESTWHNYRVHLDGTGHGLVGLDDNGLLPNFERWSGLTIGRGADAEIIPPALQLAYLAKTLKSYMRRYGSPYNAARAWHRGEGLWHDAQGHHYEQLIRAHIAALYRDA